MLQGCTHVQLFLLSLSPPLQLNFFGKDEVFWPEMAKATVRPCQTPPLGTSVSIWNDAFRIENNIPTTSFGETDAALRLYRFHYIKEHVFPHLCLYIQIDGLLGLLRVRTAHRVVYTARHRRDDLVVVHHHVPASEGPYKLRPRLSRDE